MPIIRLPTDEESELRGFRGPEAQRRRAVLRETLQAFERCQPRDRYHRLAAANLERWRREAREHSTPAVLVLPGDWGEVALTLTKRFGTCFAVLNMANAHFPGGAYGEGAVHIDTASPRVCIRGAEDRSRADLGYAWLPDTEVFPFLELRAAAQDLGDGAPFDAADARRRIAAVLDTLHTHAIRHAVLGALGCGAFRNPSAEVARLFREEIARRAGAFDVLAFAIYAAGYGPDNHAVFRTAFDRE